MALYLSSRGTPGLDRFIEYWAIGRRACLVPTAANPLEDSQRERLAAETREALEAAGLTVEVLDIDAEDVTPLTTGEYHVIAFGPGDPFYLLQQARDRGLEYALREAVAHETVLVGIGAGAMVLGPTLDPVVESSRFAPEDGAYLEGLWLTETLVLPHHNRPERAEAHATIIDRFGEQFPVVPLSDGEAVIVSSEGTRVVGEPQPAE